MLIDISEVGDFIIPTIAVFFVFVLGKMMSDTLATLITGNKVRTSIRVGMGMPVMGEFSLAIAKLGMERGGIAAPLYPVIALVTALTSLTGPYITRSSEYVANLLEQRSPRLVRAYLSRMEEWPQALRGTSKQDSEVARRIQHSIKTTVINLLIVMVIIGTGTFALHIVQRENLFSDIRDDYIGVVFAFILLTMCTPSFYVIWRNVQLIVDDGAVYVLSKRRSYKGWRYETLRIVIRDSILIVLTIFVILWFIPLFSDLFSIGSYALVIPLLLVAMVVFLVFRFVRQIHGKLTQTFSETILGEKYTSDTKFPNLDDIQSSQMAERLAKLERLRRSKQTNKTNDISEDSEETSQNNDLKKDESL